MWRGRRNQPVHHRHARAAAPTSTPDLNPAPTATPRPAPLEDRIGFPENYQEEFYLLFVFDRPDNRQVRVICGNAEAASHQPGEPFAYGSVLTMTTYRALLDTDGKPLLDDNGRYIRGQMVAVFVQRKNEGFGEAYLADRSGEWEYVAYRADGSYFTPPQNTNACAACHLNQAGEAQDFVFRMNMFHDPEAAFMAPEMGEDEVGINIYAFMPMEITVSAGATITWTNLDEATHTVTSEAFDSGVMPSASVEPGATFSFTFDTPGTYSYSCTIHPGMTGTIIVTG